MPFAQKRRDNEVNIRTIPHSEFNRLLPHNPAMENLMEEQVEWFSNRSGSLLGAVGKGECLAGWNYVILKRDMKGSFHIRKVMSNLSNLKAARVDLLLSMAEITINQPALSVLFTSAIPSGAWLTEPASSRRLQRQCRD